MNTMLCWIDWQKAAQVLATPVIGFSTLAIGGIALTIQRQQANTNRLQYRLALFERRMKVFDSTMDLIAVVLPRAFQFLRETRDHELLFGAEIKDYLDEVYRKTVRLHTIDAVSRSEDIPKRTELLDWFSRQSAVATRKFLKYLNFREP